MLADSEDPHPERKPFSPVLTPGESGRRVFLGFVSKIAARESFANDLLTAETDRPG